MPKKEDIEIVRADNFQEVDEVLTEAMKSLDAANLRIEELLQSPDADVPATSGADSDEDDAPAPEDAPDGDGTKPAPDSSSA